MTEGFEAPGGDQPPSRGRGRRRTYTVLAAVLLFVLASVVVVKAVAPALQDANERAATAEATRLLGFVRLPPGASRLGRVSIDALQAPGMGTPGAGYFVDLHQLWSVPGSMDDALSWIVAHLRPGLTSSGGASGGGPPVRTVAYSDAPSNHYIDAQLEISAADLSAGTSAVRVDAVVEWRSSKPQADPRPGPGIRVTIAGGCPATLTGYRDVSNPQRGDLGKRLLPKTEPSKAMICNYPPPPEKGQPHNTRIDLSAAQARDLARAINRILLFTTGPGIIHCPMDWSSNQILVFAYPDRSDVDLWYHNSGCAWMANGYVLQTARNNPPFGVFADQAATLTGSR